MFLVWTATWWLTLGALLHSVLPGGWLTVLGAAVLVAYSLVAVMVDAPDARRLGAVLRRRFRKGET